MDPQDKGKHKRHEGDEPDVEAHKHGRLVESPDEREDEGKDDTPDVEAHKFGRSSR